MALWKLTDEGEWDLSVSESSNKLQNKKTQHERRIILFKRYTIYSQHLNISTSTYIWVSLSLHTFIWMYLISFFRMNRRSWLPTGRSVNDIHHQGSIYPSTEWALYVCMVMYGALTPRIENILHHMDHTICCHKVTVWHIHRVDMNRVVYLGKTEKKHWMFIKFAKYRELQCVKCVKWKALGSNYYNTSDI